jgi:hypothetical protein
MKKARTFSAIIPLFETRIEVGLGVGEISSSGGECDGQTTFEDDSVIRIGFSESSPAPDLIAHEALHAVQFLEKRIETKFDDETAAYLLGWIVALIWEKVAV